MFSVTCLCKNPSDKSVIKAAHQQSFNLKKKNKQKTLVTEYDNFLYCLQIYDFNLLLYSELTARNCAILQYLTHPLTCLFIPP